MQKSAKMKRMYTRTYTYTQYAASTVLSTTVKISKKKGVYVVSDVVYVPYKWEMGNSERLCLMWNGPKTYERIVVD